jgi:polyphosphate kinase 2 (PPK2 family)
MYLQRYLEHFPPAGEIVIFDRSWYNRAGVEYVMGFCTKEQHELFLRRCPEMERYIVDSGVILIKYWLEVGQEEQERRFEARIKDKKKARLNCITHLLSMIPRGRVQHEKVKLPSRNNQKRYDDQAPLRRRRFVPQVY